VESRRHTPKPVDFFRRSSNRAALTRYFAALLGEKEPILKPISPDSLIFTVKMTVAAGNAQFVINKSKESTGE
jgi:hypothetical protein